MDKHSPNYIRSDFSSGAYGDDNKTTYVRELEVVGKDDSNVRVAAEWIRGRVMP